MLENQQPFTVKFDSIKQIHYVAVKVSVNRKLVLTLHQDESGLFQFDRRFLANLHESLKNTIKDLKIGLKNYNSERQTCTNENAIDLPSADSSIHKKHSNYEEIVCEVSVFQDNDFSEKFVDMDQHQTSMNLESNTGSHESKISYDTNGETGEEKCFVCSRCQMVFSSLEEMEAHQKLHSNDEYLGEQIITDTKSNAATRCPTFIGQMTKLHDIIQANEKPSVHSYQSSPKIKQEHFYAVKKSFSCNYCNKSFSHVQEMMMHECSNLGKKTYECTYCRKLFFNYYHKMRHEKIHTSERAYKCSYCGKSFFSFYHKTRHEMIHTGEKPFRCSYCDKAFNQRETKKQHECIHTGEKPYSCIFCDKSFIRLQRLKIHERIHTGVRPYSCSYCEKKFTDFRDKKYHERIHTGEKPYSCSHCPKSFSQSSQRLRHERIHASETCS